MLLFMCAHSDTNVVKEHDKTPIFKMSLFDWQAGSSGKGACCLSLNT